MKKIKIKKRNKKSFFTTKNILLGSLALVVGVVPIGVGISQVVNPTSYMLGNMKFNSMNSAINYVKNNSVKNNVQNINSTWEIKVNGIVKKFNSPEELRAYVTENFISSKQYASSVDLNQYKNESGMIGVNDSAVWENIFELNSKDEVTQNLTKLIYQGKDDIAYSNTLDNNVALQKAIDSYFQEHNVYYFNNIYFNSQQDLKNYLISYYLPNQKENINTIVLKGPNGVESAPININDSNTALTYINTFIENNANKVLSYQKDDGSTLNITSSNINQAVSQVNLSDMNYIHMQSNQGQSRYVLDNTDDANLIGPYFYNGTLDVGSFMNKSMWKKVNKVTDSVYVESKVDSMIGTFFSSIIVDDKAISLKEAQDSNKDVPLFRTGLVFSDGTENNSETTVTLDEWFLEQLSLWSPTLKNQVVAANLSLMSGNKYNTFYKIPILYSFLMQRIVTLGLNQKVIELVNYYFKAVCDYIQDAIEIAVIDDSLLTGINGDKFDAASFFNIGNPEYDLNTSVEYYMNKMKQYPSLIAAMSTYVGAYNSVIMTAGMMPYYSYDQSYLFENGIISREQFKAIQEKLSNIFFTYSQTNYNSMVFMFVNNSTNPLVQQIKTFPTTEWDKKLDETGATRSMASFGVILKAVGLRNSQQHTLARSILNSEIRIYLESGSIVNNGYLDMLYNPDSSKNKLDLFVKFVKNFQNLDTYKVYMAFLLDTRMNTKIINSQTTSSTTAFAQALVNVITLTLGSAYLVKDTVANIFQKTNNRAISSNQKTLPTPQQHPIWDILDYAEVKDVNDTSTLINSRTKVPLQETDWTLYALPSTLIKNVTNNPAGEQIVDNYIDKHFSWVSDFDLDFDDDVIESKPVTVMLNPGQTKDEQVKSIVRAFSDSDETISVSKNGQKFDLNIDSGTQKLDRKIRLIFPMDEADAIDAANFNAKTIFSKKKVDIPDFAPVNGMPNESTSFKRQSTKFSWNFRRTVSGTGIKDSLNVVWSSAKELISNLTSVLFPVISTALMGMQIFFFVLQIIQEERIQDFYQYTTADGTHFYWDGGLTVSKFMGLTVNQVTGIESMKLMTPVQITMPQLEEYYYYNGNKYYNTDELKKAQLTYMVESKEYTNTNPKFVTSYTLNGSKDNWSDIATSLEELKQKILNDLNITKNNDNTYNFSNINLDSSYISSKSFTTGNGQIIGSSDIVGTANNIVRDIRPTKIALLPEVDSNNKTTGKLKDFVLPGNYWDGKKVVTNQDTSMKYIIDNSANLLDNSTQEFVEDAIVANAKASANLKNAFVEKVSSMISSKAVLGNEYKETDKYSEMSSNWNVFNIYSTNIDNQMHYFLTSNDAYQYIYSQLMFAKNDNKITTYSYTYNGIYFANESELVNWVKKNLVKI